MKESKWDVIKTADNVCALTGVGEEWLLDLFGEPLAVYKDGVLIVGDPDLAGACNRDEVTITPDGLGPKLA